MSTNTQLFSKNTTILAIIVLAVISRIIPHPYNFAPFGAIALFCGAFISSRWLAVMVPCIASWISGVILNNTVYKSLFPEFTWFDSSIIWQCLAYTTMVLLAGKWLSANRSIPRIGMSAVGSSLLFFIISNFGCWVSGTMYTKDFAGLTATYISALPFYPATLAGDLLYTGVMFGLFSLVSVRNKSWQPSDH